MSKYTNPTAIEQLRTDFGTREFINAPRKELEQFLDEQLEKKEEEVINAIAGTVAEDGKYYRKEYDDDTGEYYYRSINVVQIIRSVYPSKSQTKK
jgi:hypothetical protein